MYYTKYAEKKFDILNKYKVFFTKEQIEDCITAPEKQEKKKKYLTAEKEGIKVIYKKDNEEIRVITFYPIK